MQKRLPVMILWWLNAVACMAMTASSLPAQVISRVARTSFIPPVQVETWPVWLSMAWQKVSPPQSGELQQVVGIRMRIVRLLADAGQMEQAFAAAGTLQGLERYQSFAYLAAHSEGKLHESAVDEAQRGFQFLSVRNQEVLVADLMPITTPKGKEAFREMLSRCVERDERILALGQAAASAAANEPDIFEECLTELSSDVSGLNPLDKRYTAVALQVAAEGLRKADSKGDGRWLEICQLSAGVLEKTPINSAEIFVNLASSCFAGGKETEGQEMLQRALEHWRRLGIGTHERMQAMVSITEAAIKSKQERLPANWSARAVEEAQQGKNDWRWDLMVKAGRICRLTGDQKNAVITWKSAIETASSNDNPMVEAACGAMLVMEAHEGGIAAEEIEFNRLGLNRDEETKKEETSGF